MVVYKVKVFCFDISNREVAQNIIFRSSIELSHEELVRKCKDRVFGYIDYELLEMKEV